MKSCSSLIIENSKGEYLLQQKDDSYPKYPNYWSLIGGEIERSETPLKAVTREIKEEINLIIENLQEVGFQEINGIKEYIFYVKIDLDESKIKIGEGVGVKYFSKNDVEELDILPKDKAMLDYFFKKIEEKEIKNIVKQGYKKIVEGGCSCGCGVSNEQISKSIGYSDEQINNVPEANLGLGCGNPTALGEIKQGEIVVDLGSGAGFDAFLVAKKVGTNGKVIGIDMTEEMIEKAKANAKKYNYKNTEFRLGDIEKLPIEDNSIDVVISNCVINLAPNKDKVFSESYRVLKKGGKMFVSDIVLLGELTDEQKKDEGLLTGCVAGALQKEDYLQIINDAGFEFKILNEDKDISKRQYECIALESLKLEITKN